MIYARVSQDRSGDGRSVEEQVKELTGEIERRGWELVGVESDRAISASRYAKTRERPGWDAIQEWVRSGRVECVAVWEQSRQSRELETWAAWRNLCLDRGVIWLVRDRIVDPTEAVDRFQSGVQALMDEKSSDETRARINRAIAANVAAGRPHGKHLYGYRRIYDPTTKKLLRVEEEPEQADIVREIFKRTLAGESARSIALDLVTRGVPGRRPLRTAGSRLPWEATSIVQLLKCPAYAGLRAYQGQVVGDAIWEGIIEKDDFFKVQGILADPERRSRREAPETHLLSGIALCGVCEGKMYVLQNRGYPAYSCRTATRLGVKGFHLNRKAAWLEAFVTEAVLARLERSDLVERLATAEAGVSAAAVHASGKVAALRDRLAEIEEALVRGELSPVMAGRAESALMAQIAEAEAEAKRLVLPPVVAAVAGEDARERWEELSVEQRRVVIGALCRVMVLKTRQGVRRFDPSDVAIRWTLEDGDDA